MKRMVRAGLAWLFFASAGWGQASLVADAHVNAALPTVNSGAISNVNVGGGYTGLLQFDLSLLPAGTTAAQISRAVLRVYVNRVDTAGLVSVAAVTSGWSEYGVTYATMPGVGSAAQVFTVSTAGEFVAVDVTGLVQGWVAAPATNFGVALTAGTAVLELDSKENDLTGHAAELAVTIVSQGPTGATGATGPAGPVGATGPQGPVGATGAVGPQGLVGPAGPAGAQGAMGLQGPAGPVGATGPAGAIGPQGPQGIAGTAGAQGLTGATGAQGLQGPAGPQGAAGPVGLTMRGAYSSVVNYGVGDGVSWQGSGYVSLIASNHGNTPDQSPAEWALFAEAGAAGAAGATGATGPAGPQGLQGPRGMTGATGAVGPVGPQGPAVVNYTGNYSSVTSYGVADAVSYGGSTYVSLVAANHGNTPGLSPDDWAVLAAQGATGATGAQGPQGVAGATGATGPMGATGAQGPPVTFRGEWLVGTAYAVGDAVGYGGASYIALTANTGREPDVSPVYWGLLAAAGSPGATGAQGPQGLQGPTGYAGVTGPQGPAGPTGATGPVGPQGPAGQTGPQGIPGTNGTNGVNGLTGPVGPQGPAGPTGATGATGINFRGAWVAGSGYAVDDAVTFGGATYLAQAPNNNVEPDTNTYDWAVLAAAGGAGPTGAAGTAATVTVGTVTTGAAGTQAAVTNSGTAQAAVLNFTIPQGAAGGGGGGGGTGSASGVPMVSMYHAVSYAATYYSVANTNQSATEGAAELTWVPNGCTATKLVAYSQQNATITVTLRVGAVGAMADTGLSCAVATGQSCTATGAVAVGAGEFVDLGIYHPDSNPSGVWVAVSCN